jgi:hypothetical protein
MTLSAVSISTAALAADASQIIKTDSVKMALSSSTTDLNAIACFRFDDDPIRCAARLDCVWIPITRRCRAR